MSKHYFPTIIASASLAVALALTGCAAGNSDSGNATGGSTPSATSAAPSPTPTLSDIDADVQAFTAALDALGIQHTAPVRSSVGLSGAEASFDIIVDGFDAGINVFPDADTLAAWGKISDQVGGIYVSYQNGALTLNSTDGVADSASIAPKIAAQVGGEAHGV